MDRRGVLTLIGAVLAGAALHRLPVFRELRPRPRPTELRFPVAGVRFHRLASRPRPGDHAYLSQEIFRGETSYAVVSASGEKVGYVPRHTTLRIGGRRVAYCAFSDVNPYAVPWKRYEITVRLL